VRARRGPVARWPPPAWQPGRVRMGGHRLTSNQHVACAPRLPALAIIAPAGQTATARSCARQAKAARATSAGLLTPWKSCAWRHSPGQQQQWQQPQQRLSCWGAVRLQWRNMALVSLLKPVCAARLWGSLCDCKRAPASRLADTVSMKRPPVLCCVPCCCLPPLCVCIPACSRWLHANANIPSSRAPGRGRAADTDAAARHGSSSSS
jgi:hypothetical protein